MLSFMWILFFYEGELVIMLVRFRVVFIKVVFVGSDGKISEKVFFVFVEIRLVLNEVVIEFG